MLRLVPLPNAGANLLRYQRADKQTDNQYLARGEHQFNARHQLSDRYFFDRLDIPAIADKNNILTAIANRRWQSRSAVGSGATHRETSCRYQQLSRALSCMTRNSACR